MDMHVKLLWDKYGTREFVFYRTGEFSKPIMILTEGFAERFFESFKQAIEHPPCRVRTIEYLSENLKNNNDISGSVKHER